MQPESERELSLRWRKTCLSGPDRYLGRFTAGRLGSSDRCGVQREPAGQKTQSVHQKAEHLALDAHQVLPSAMVSGAADQIWKQVRVVLAGGSVKTQLRVIGLSLLHDRQGDNFWVGHVHATCPVSESNPVGLSFWIEVVSDPSRESGITLRSKGRIRSQQQGGPVE